MRDADYGRGVVELDERDVPPTATDLVNSLVATFSAPSYQPPVLPRAATELLALSQQHDASVTHIVELLESDAVLAGRTLSRANSAGTTRGAVRSIREAVSRLGLMQLRDLVLEQAMNLRVFRAPGYQSRMEALSAHASTTAEFARVVCRYATLDGELAFLAGLLHDIGIAGVLIAMSERPRAERPDPLVLDYALAEAHTLASERMATLWSLPSELVMVARYHHELDIGGYVHPLCAVVVVAEAEAEARGVGLAGSTLTDAHRPETVRRAREALGLDERRLALIRLDLAKLMSAESGRATDARPDAARR